MVTVADTSPYLYLATSCFALAALSSDLLFIRLALTFGFLFLVLASLSGQSQNGSFDTDTMPLAQGVVDVTMLVNFLLCLLNVYVCVRLVRDDQEHALFHYFAARCGTTPLQFQCILQNGYFVTLPAQTVVPHTPCTLYLVCQGLVQCDAKYHPSSSAQGEQDNNNNNNTGGGPAKSFFKRSGQFFDIKLFNLFGLPVGFDNLEFRATTTTPCQLFAWPLDGMIAMRESPSPSLLPYWEYMVLRALTGVAVQHHLNATDTLYDALLLPEDAAWLDGAPSRDFVPSPHGTRSQSSFSSVSWNAEWWRQQWRIVRAAWLQIIPPHGIRHRPGAVTYVHPKRNQLEHQCRAAAQAQMKFSFLQASGTVAPEVVEPDSLALGTAPAVLEVPDSGNPSLEDPETGSLD